jgi:hypothetical protein
MCEHCEICRWLSSSPRKSRSESDYRCAQRQEHSCASKLLEDFWIHYRLPSGGDLVTSAENGAVMKGFVRAGLARISVVPTFPFFQTVPSLQQTHSLATIFHLRFHVVQFLQMCMCISHRHRYVIQHEGAYSVRDVTPQLRDPGELHLNSHT